MSERTPIASNPAAGAACVLIRCAALPQLGAAFLAADSDVQVADCIVDPSERTLVVTADPRVARQPRALVAWRRRMSTLPGSVIANGFGQPAGATGAERPHA